MSGKKWTKREYHVQHNKDVDHQDVKTYCATNQFPEVQFLGPHNKPYGVCVLNNHQHMRFDTKIGHVTCAIRRIPCDCTSCTYVLDQPWVTGMPAHKQPLYQPIQNFTYWSVLGSFKNWNIQTLSHKTTYSE